MAPETPFDRLAEDYDSHFTRSAVGVILREIVQGFMKTRISKGSEVLEVNCGTGEDALYLSGLGCRVTATDASMAMIRVCSDKLKTFSGSNSPIFRQAAIRDIDSVVSGRKFNLIFSNFSGLNCLDPQELKDTAGRFHSLLKPGGKMIFVLFGTNCLWEKLYFFLKGRTSEINRRSTQKPVYVKLGNSEMQVYYYTPGAIRDIFDMHFKVISLRPIGLFIPPTYLDSFFERRRILLRMLTLTDRLAAPFPLLSNLADHYLVELEKL